MSKFDNVLGEVIDLSDSIEELNAVSLDDLLNEINWGVFIMIKWCPVMGNVIHLSDSDIAELDKCTYEDLLKELTEGSPKW